MRIPDEKIEDVRRSNDIVDVLSPYVRLKKRGKNYIGLCPFHKEKTPSFTVSVEKQMYHCFGCSKGGNVFTFVMEMEKISFVEAVRSLAARVGIEIPDDSQFSSEQKTQSDQLHAVCRFAGLVFYENLVNSDEGKAALEYFHKRGFTDETIRTFGLGYSLNSWDAFVVRAKAEGFSSEDCAKAGLARQREDGSLYDYFRGRAMFPIFSTAGRVIGFGARKMREDDPIAGKYINSPETPLYNKSRVLFGLSHAKEAIRREESVLMVEGYADCISLYQAGIQNVVASSGTALTEEQLTLIGHYTHNLTLIYDGDSAGSNATLRGIDLALAQDFDINIVELPEEDDPDSFVQKNGGHAFRELMKNTVSFIEFKTKKYLDAGVLATPAGKTNALRSIVQSIAKINDELKRNIFIKDVSDKFQIYESVLFRELEHALAQEKKDSRRPAETARSGERSQPEPVQPPKPAAPAIPAEERDILKIFLEGNFDLIRFILSNVGLDQMTDTRVRSILQRVLDMVDETGSFEVNRLLAEMQDPEIKGLISDALVSKYELSRNWYNMEKEIEEADPWKIARDSVVAIQKKNVQKEMERNEHLLKEVMQNKGDTLPYLQREEDLKKLQRELNSPEYLKMKNQP
jgi:DNA primase